MTTHAVPPAATPAAHVAQRLRQTAAGAHAHVAALRDAKYRSTDDGKSPFADHDLELAWAEKELQSYLDTQATNDLGAGHDVFTPEQERQLIQVVLDKMYGLGSLDRMLRDPNVTDIHIMGADHCMMRTRDGRWVPAGAVAANDEDLIRLIQTAAARFGGNIERRFDSLNPSLNMQLRDGSRLFALRDVVDRPQAVIRKHSDEFSSLENLVEAGMLSPRGAHFLEFMVKGRRNGVIIGSTGSGKMEPLDSRIPTPNGSTTVGELRPGDEVFGSDGQPIKLLGLSPVRHEAVWTVTFEDGRTVRCGGEHLWEVSSAYSRAQQTPTHVSLREDRQGRNDAALETLRARVNELPADLYGTIPQIADWGGLSVTPLHRVTPQALAVTREVEGGVGGPRPNEVDASALWAWLDGRTATVGGTAVTTELLERTRPEPGAWLTSRQVTERLTGGLERASRDSVDRLVRSSGVARRPGRRAAATVTVYPAREVLYRYLQDLERRRTGDVPLTTVLSTEELAAEVRVYGGRANWAVEHQPALDLPDADLPVDPWLLGVWLGDGATDSGRLHVGDSDVREVLNLVQAVWPNAHARQEKLPASTCWTVYCPKPLPGVCPRGHQDAERRSHGARGFKHCVECERMRQQNHPDYVTSRMNVSLRSTLRNLDVLGAKHIPDAYLRGSHMQRLELLQGLMDADGTIDRNGNCELALSDARLASDAVSLIRSLGIKASMTTSGAGYRDSAGAYIQGKDRHRIHFTTDQQVFRLTRKAERLPTTRSKGDGRVAIVSIERSDEVVPQRCLYVDSADHLYLTGDYIATHNTTLLRALCAEMPPHEHKVTIEEAKEIGLDRDRSRHPLCRALETRPPDMQGNGEYGAERLVRDSLRMDPDRIILGEVRGGEALQMLLAMTQGQKGSLCTMHGESAVIAYPRLQWYVKMGGVQVPDEDVARFIVDAVHFVIFITKVVLPDGKTYKRVIEEIVETRSNNGTQVTSNVVMKRNAAGELVPVMKPSERTLVPMMQAGFQFDWWWEGADVSMAASTPTAPASPPPASAGGGYEGLRRGGR